MPTKVIIVADPGIDTTFAIALALHDPNIDVLGLIASAGNVSAEQATRNIHYLINHLDVPRWPRVGAALPFEYEIDGMKLHGPSGLGGLIPPPVSLHQPTPGDKLLVELIRKYPKEVVVLVLGPATMLACAMERDPELADQIARIVMVGGTRYEPGNAGPVSEFHVACDPLSAKQVVQCGAPILMLPLDVTRKLVLAPGDLFDMTAAHDETGQLLRQIVPFGIRASSQLYGIEGFHLKDVSAVAAVALPGKVEVRSLYVDVETGGDLTRGMTVVDTRARPAGPPNVQWAVGIDGVGVRDYIRRTLLGS